MAASVLMVRVSVSRAVWAQTGVFEAKPQNPKKSPLPKIKAFYRERITLLNPEYCFPTFYI